MANEKLKLKELGVRVEATFEWPGQPDGSAPISMPEAATEIGERLQALEERLAPVARGPEAPAQLGAAADPVVPPAAEPTAEVAQVERLLESWNGVSTDRSRRPMTLPGSPPASGISKPGLRCPRR